MGWSTPHVLRRQRQDTAVFAGLRANRATRRRRWGWGRHWQAGPPCPPLCSRSTRPSIYCCRECHKKASPPVRLWRRPTNADAMARLGNVSIGRSARSSTAAPARSWARIPAWRLSTAITSNTCRSGGRQLSLGGHQRLNRSATPAPSRKSTTAEVSVTVTRRGRGADTSLGSPSVGVPRDLTPAANSAGVSLDADRNISYFQRYSHTSPMIPYPPTGTYASARCRRSSASSSLECIAPISSRRGSTPAATISIARSTSTSPARRSTSARTSSSTSGLSALR